MINLPCESLRQFDCSVQPNIPVGFQQFDALILFPDDQLQQRNF
jgi:hypothetical protein